MMRDRVGRPCTPTWAEDIRRGEPYPSERMRTCRRCGFEYPRLYFVNSSDAGECLDCDEAARSERRGRKKHRRRKTREAEDPELRELRLDAERDNHRVYGKRDPRSLAKHARKFRKPSRPATSAARRSPRRQLTTCN